MARAKRLRPPGPARLARPGLRSFDIASLAEATADAWVSWWAEQLRAQGRTMSGGWPGTLREARGRVLASLAACAPYPVLGDEDLLALMHVVNDAARGRWLAVAEADSER